jgi:hypothetical protein
MHLLVNSPVETSVETPLRVEKYPSGTSCLGLTLGEPGKV